MVKTVSYFIKQLLKYLISIILVVFFVSAATANYDSFLSDLKKSWIDVENIQSSKTISRYTLTKLLNGVNCKDCINPDSNMINKYTYEWWQNFSIGRDFWDISYLWGFYGWESYYFCVAYVWDNVWMRWYPEGTSPVCNGMFCGNRNVTVWEFLQVVLNIADQYVYDRYSVDWRVIENWLNSLQSGSYAYQYLTDSDRNIITEYANQALYWSLPNEESLQPYLKYCMFNLDACNMKSFGKVWQWYWPVAELNILYDNDIVEFEKFESWQTDKSVEWDYVLQVLYKLFEIIDCNFNYDYDCDWLINSDDNCPNDYNPSQTDTDWDLIWDVCDDDVDWDDVKNLVWIVDDLGHIVVWKWDKKLDNCPLVKNKNQKDSNRNGVWDACEWNNNLWMYIKINKIENVAPARVEFEAITKWNVVWDVQWKFSDGSVAVWKKVTHVFDQAGLFAIQAVANWEKNNAIASTTVLIWKWTSDIYAMQINATPSTSIPTQISFSLDAKWSFDRFEWSFWDWTKTEKKDKSSILKLYSKEWSYLVTVKWYKNSEIVAVASVIVWAWKNMFRSNMNVDDLNPNIWDNIVFSTSIAWIKESNIKNVLWIFWDWKEERTKELKTYHKYDIVWQYVIIQTINFVDWSKVQNYLTLYVRDKTIENSYAIQVIPSEILWSTAESIIFREERVWSLPNILINLNEYQLWHTEKSYENLNVWPKNFEYKYNKWWIFNPTFFVYVDECIDLETTSTLVAVDADTCFDAMINGSLWKYKCDMDDDWVPDICDDDIDGDWIKNLVWIIKYENSDCSITTDNINYDIFLSHKNICSLDNCPISDNLMQLDVNNNWFWDSCDSMVVSISSIIGNDSNYNSALDFDWDWIIDSLDSCPNIPEKYNWVQDYDGCPEIWLNNNCGISNFKYFDGTFWNNTDEPTIPPCSGPNCNVCTWDIHNCYIIPEDPENPVVPCTGFNCNNVCTWDVNNCPTCNWDPGCEICLSNPGSCSSWTWWVWPYSLTARCEPENIIYNWNNIMWNNFSFNWLFPWSCPCKECHWYVQDSNWLITATWNFQVCNEWCWIISNWPEDPVIWCTWSNCNVCTWNVDTCVWCNWDPECELCLLDPELCWMWTWWVWPYSVTAWCEPENIIYSWNNIMWNNFSFNWLFSWACPCKTCHWYVQDSEGNISYTRDFQVCNDGCESPIDPCIWNPFCVDCIDNPDNCINISDWPADLLVQCEPDLEYYRSNIDVSSFSLANKIPWDCPCRQCQWSSTSSWGVSTWSFQVCEPWCSPDQPWWGWIDIPININGTDTPIIVSECLSCPCNYVDFANSLNIDDKVKAILRDDSLTTLYNRSVPVFLKEFL